MRESYIYLSRPKLNPTLQPQEPRPTLTAHTEIERASVPRIQTSESRLHPVTVSEVELLSQVDLAAASVGPGVAAPAGIRAHAHAIVVGCD